MFAERAIILRRDGGAPLVDLLAHGGRTGFSNCPACRQLRFDIAATGFGPGTGSAGMGCARQTRAIAGTRRPACVRRFCCRPVGLLETVARRAVLRPTGDGCRVGPSRGREPLGDERSRLLAQRLGVLRGLGGGQAHGTTRPDRPAVRALTFGEPGEEGLTELALDRLGIRTHRGRLLRPLLGFAVAERRAVLEALHPGEVGTEALLQARQLALTR